LTTTQPGPLRRILHGGTEKSPGPLYEYVFSIKVFTDFATKSCVLIRFAVGARASAEKFLGGGGNGKKQD